MFVQNLLMYFGFLSRWDSKVVGEHPFCVLIYMNSYIFHIYFSCINFIVISNIRFCMLDVIIGRHKWNCQIRTHIHTGYTHTRTHSKKNKQIRKSRKKDRKKAERTKKRMGGQERKKEMKRRRTRRKGGKKRGKWETKGGRENKKKKERKRGMG